MSVSRVLLFAAAVCTAQAVTLPVVDELTTSGAVAAKAAIAALNPRLTDVNVYTEQYNLNLDTLSAIEQLVISASSKVQYINDNPHTWWKIRALFLNLGEVETRLDALPKFTCFRGQSCWPTAAEVAALSDALEPTATRLLKQEAEGPKIAPLAPALSHLSDEENTQPLYGLGVTQMKPLYERTDLTTTCRNELQFTSEYCKSHVRNAYFNDDPDFVVFPLTAAHVQTALAFAKDHELCVVVAGTGHDFNGRNQNICEGGSILIRTMLMRSKSIDVDDTQGLGYPSVTFGPGIIFSEAQHFATQNGKMIATGTCETVGIVGWTLGGGHGPFAGRLGYGADNLLAADVVLASGEIVTAKADSEYADLYKALRGGGGSAWGIITSITVRAHEIADTGVSYVIGNVASGKLEETEKLWNTTEAWMPHYLNSGVNTSSMITLNINATEGTWVTGVFGTVYGGLESEATQNFIQELKDIGNTDETILVFTGADPYVLFEFGIIPSTVIPFDGPLGNYPYSAAFVQREDMDLVGDSYVYMTETCKEFCTIGVGSFLTGNIGAEQATGTSLSEGMRTGLGFAISSELYHQQHFQDTFGVQVYMNEASPELTDVGYAFWGDNFADLKATKQKYDPTGVFKCHQCVGQV